MRFEGNVKQISDVKRSTKQGDRHFVQVLIRGKTNGNAVTLVLEPENCDYVLGEEVAVDVIVARPQSKIEAE
jgi:hypothetical protein